MRSRAVSARQILAAHRARQQADERKERALRVRCPRCCAHPGKKCWSILSTGTVDYVHQERYDAAEKGESSR